MKRIRMLMVLASIGALGGTVFPASPAAAVDSACPNNAYTLRLGIPGFGTRSMTGNDRVFLGRANVSGAGTKLMGYVDNGNNTCTAYWVLDSNGNALTGEWSNYNNFCTGAGVDQVLMTLPFPGVECTNLPAMTAWNYNGYQLMVYLEEGNDSFYGGAGKDNVVGGGGNDNISLYGGTGDLGWGESGADTIYADSANAYIQGGSENDTCNAGNLSSTSDYINGGTGDDYVDDSNATFLGMDGGPGTDRCAHYVGAINCEIW